MDRAEDLFSQTYAEARRRFMDAAEAAGLSLQSHAHPSSGRDGEALALDVVREGPPDAPRLLILSSGCHGVEGFCGSAVQTALLRDTAWRASARAAGIAVLYLHALNPYGFSWWRRHTHENIDLNRNFRDFSQPLPANPAYDLLADLLVPETWPPGGDNRLALLGFIQSQGMKALQAAVSAGQYTHPDGLFYGGNAPSWSQLRLREVLRQHASSAGQLAWMDWHTGLGPSGVGELILASRPDPQALARARRWWGARVTCDEDGSSVSAPLTGQCFHAAHEECPQAEYTGIVLEFGTVPMLDVLEALRADQWLHRHPQAPAAQREQIKRQIRDAFYTDTADWKRQVLAQSMQAAAQAVAGLGGTAT